MRCGSSLSKASLWTRILAWLLLHVSAVRPSHDETSMRAMRFAGPEDQDDANRSLFENLPGKLEPIVGKKLPLWQVEAGVMGGLVLLLILVLLVVLCRGSKTPAAGALPSAVGGEEDKGAEGATADEKLSRLKKQKTKLLMHQVIEKQKLERVLKDIMQLEAEKNQEGDVDPEAVKAKAQDALKAADLTMQRNMTTAVAYMMPMVVQSQRIYDTIDKRTKKAQEMIARAAVEEVKNLTKDMQDVFEVQDIKAQIFKSIGEIDTPSLATVVASAFAPAQLRALHLSNLISTAVVFLAVLVDAFVLFGDRGSKCNSYVGTGDKIGMVDFWYQVDLGISSFCFLVRYWTYLTLKPIVEDLNSPPVIELQDDPVKVLRSLLAYYLNTGSQAILKVDSVSGSYLYALSNWSVVFNLLWIGFAGDVVLNTPWKVCANVGMVVLRIRFILFLILIVPVLLNVVLFFAGRFLSGQGLQITLLNTANAADEGLGLGVPVCSVLVQAFFIRNKRDMINIQLKLLQMKKDEAEKRRLEAEAELKSLQGNEESSTAEVQKLQESLQQEAGKTPDDSHKEQEEHREKVLGEAEQVFGLLNERAKKASAEAEAQVKKWEDGDGGELLQAMSKGEGAAKLQQMLGQVDYRGMASDYAAQAQKMAGDLQEQDWVKDAAKRAADAAQAAQQSSQELYNSEQMQQMLSSEQMQSALATGQEAAANAAAAASTAVAASQEKGEKPDSEGQS